MANQFGAPGGVVCAVGVIVPAPLTSQFTTGTHVLTDAKGNVLLTLQPSDQVDLTRFSGLAANVCGQVLATFSQIHGLQTTMRVLLVQPLPAQPSGGAPVAVHARPAARAGCG